MSGSTPTMTPSLERAVAALCANDPDMASVDNGIGFNGQDTKFGHRLNGTPPDQWTPQMAFEAWLMLKKYRRQLAQAGIDYDALPKPPEPDEFYVTQGRDHARQAEYKRKDRDPSNLIFEELPGGRAAVASKRYNEALRVAARRAGAEWDSAGKRWLFEDAETAKRLYEALREGRDPDEVIQDARKMAMRVEDLGADGFALHYPYDEQMNDRVRGLPGSAFDRTRKCWVVPRPGAPEVLAFASEHGFEVPATLEEVVHAVGERRALSAAHDANFHPEGFNGELRPFQRAGVLYGIDAGNVFIGDEMGLGKTPQSIAIAEHTKCYPCVVIVPDVVKEGWAKEELPKFVPHRSKVMLGGRKPPRGIEHGGWDYYVLNYDVLSARHRNEAGEMVYSWIEVFRKLGVRTVIFDEAHYMKDGGAQRSKAALALSQLPTVERRILLSGTPVVNKPSEWVSQLAILGVLDSEFGGAANFVRRWGYRSAENETDRAALHELVERLRGVCYVRRRKADVFPELPPVERVHRDMPLDEAVDYARYERDFLEWIEKKARELAALDPDSDSDEEVRKAIEKAMRAEKLVRLNVLRQAAAKAKLAAVKRWVQYFLESSEEKLLVYAWHKEIQAGLIDVLPGAADLRPGPQRNDEKNRFQNDPTCRVAVASIVGSSVGMTLTAANHVAFVELPWTPKDEDQAIGRIYGRVNDLHGATAHFLLNDETIDADMAALIEKKRTIGQAAMDGDVSAGPDGQDMDFVIDRMKQRAARHAQPAA